MNWTCLDKYPRGYHMELATLTQNKAEIYKGQHFLALREDGDSVRIYKVKVRYEDGSEGFRYGVFVKEGTPS